MPPIINSQHTKITLDTKNVFIDLTATDKTKLGIVTNIMVSMFSQYCKDPFTYVWLAADAASCGVRVKEGLTCLYRIDRAE